MEECAAAGIAATAQATTSGKMIPLSTPSLDFVGGNPRRGADPFPAADSMPQENRSGRWHPRLKKAGK